MLERRGHTEASVDLVGLAGLRPAAVIAELMNDDGTVAGRQDVVRFANRFGLKVVRVEDLVEHRWRTEAIVGRVSDAIIPTSQGRFLARAYRCDLDGSEHVALSMGELSSARGVLTHVHCSGTA